jgi:hypothetical protein
MNLVDRSGLIVVYLAQTFAHAFNPPNSQVTSHLTFLSATTFGTTKVFEPDHALTKIPACRFQAPSRCLTKAPLCTCDLARSA